MATTLDKAHGKSIGSIVERLVKIRPSTIFGHLEYSLDYPGPLIEFLVLHEEFLNSALGIWLGGEKIQMDAAYQSVCTKYGRP